VANPVWIDDPTDPRLSDYVGLKDLDLRRDRDAFIAEGVLVIRQLLQSSYPVRSVLLTEARWRDLAGALASCRAPVFLAPLEVMRAVTGFNIHRGAVASATRLPLPEPRVLATRARRLAILEGVNDHENLGGLFRNAAAFGFDAVLLDPTSADPLYRRSVRVSMGHALHVPFSRLSPWPEALSTLAPDFMLAALTPRSDAIPITSLDVPDGRRLAFMLGAEGPGLSDAALGRAGVLVRIPMAAGVDSLNVATAAAIAFHHAARL
jgi:tRNA G18 (ribose-2'-O)-methylase SpoU